MTSPRLTQLADWLSGEFENQAQAQSQPIWFVSLRLWYRPLPMPIDGKLALFAEQAPALKPDQAYRQRILLLWEEGAQLRGQYWAFRDPERVRGAGQNSDLLRSLSEADFEPLLGCTLAIEDRGDRFRGELEPGAKCCFTYAGQVRQVVVGFEVSPTQLLSFDRGVDPETGKGLWGALMGPYEFQKRVGYSV